MQPPDERFAIGDAERTRQAQPEHEDHHDKPHREEQAGWRRMRVKYLAIAVIGCLYELGYLICRWKMRAMRGERPEVRPKGGTAPRLPGEGSWVSPWPLRQLMGK